MNREKANRLWFKSEVTRRIVALGAQRDDNRDEYTLQTTAGLLHVSPYDGWIACRFDEPKRAIAEPRLNPVSGKWNHHYGPFSSRADAQWAVDWFFNDLGRYL
jgi:hypothetical protein